MTIFEKLFNNQDTFFNIIKQVHCTQTKWNDYGSGRENFLFLELLKVALCKK
jgi:hypothetical protein